MKMKWFRNAAMLTGILFFSTGCAAVLLGTGTGAGVYTWVKGELVRAYSATFKQTEAAVLETLPALRISIDEKTETPSRLSLKASHHDGTPVSIKIETKTYNMTEVSVRYGRVGFFDRENAEQVHASILKRLYP